MNIALSMIELSSLNADASKLIQRISAVLTGPERPEILRYQDLEEVPVLAGWMSGDGIHSQRLPLEGSLYFRSEFEARAQISIHYHDCMEVIWVESGSLVDLVSGKAYTAGQRAVFPAGVPHKLASPEGCAIFTQLIK